MLVTLALLWLVELSAAVGGSLTITANGGTTLTVQSGGVLLVEGHPCCVGVEDAVFPGASTDPEPDWVTSGGAFEAELLTDAQVAGIQAYIQGGGDASRIQIASDILFSAERDGTKPAHEITYIPLEDGVRGGDYRWDEGHWAYDYAYNTSVTAGTLMVEDFAGDEQPAYSNENYVEYKSTSPYQLQCRTGLHGYCNALPMPWNLEGVANAVGYTHAIISKVRFSPEEAGSDTNPLFVNAGHEGQYGRNRYYFYGTRYVVRFPQAEAKCSAMGGWECATI